MFPKTPIEYFAKVGAGQGAPQKESDFSIEGFPFIRAGHLEDLINGRNELSLPLVNEIVARKHRLKLYPANTIIFAKSGMSATKGRIYKLKNPCYIVNHLAILELKVNAYPDFIMFALRNFSPVKLINDSAYPSINQDAIEKFKIPFPERIETQIHIANLLSKSEDLINQRKETIHLLDEFLKSTFLEMFGDPVNNEKRWKTKTIVELVKSSRHSIKRGPFGGSLKKEIFVPSGYLVYEQYHALNNDFTFGRYYIDEQKYQELKAFEVNSGDIIISCSGVYLGKLAIVPENAKKGIINQALLKISLDDKIINNQFFIFLFSHNSFKRKFFGDIRGTGIPNFPPMEDFKKFKFIYPPIELQTQFSQIVQKTESLKSQYHTSLQQLENLYASLSQKAFKGELNLSKEEELTMAAENIENYHKL